MKQNTRVHTPRSIGFAFSVLTALGCLSGTADATGLIMPIYGNTSAQFNAAVAAAQKAPMIAIINPDDGPGSTKVAGISSNVARLKSSNAKVAGYISTNYGGTSLSSVYQQIDRYVSWYSANGIFLDEAS
ncbi:MAG: conserved hypothetical signal peptide protein, partial [Verrucomicrobiaceae bacterium]|nr:conserved hypothetical signal peptide protein [Verrucomicrobiaceae bacterium]